MSIASLLSIAKTALGTHQRAMNVTGHNIANASTPGYTRQRLEIEAMTPQRTPWGTVGRGVTDAGVFANRDRFLDTTFRRENGVSGQAGTMRDLLGQVEEVFGEPSETGIGASIDAMFDAFSDLANDPASAPARTVVQQNALRLTQVLHQTDGRLNEVDRNARETMRDTITEVNAIAKQIADLNKQIVSAGGPLGTAPDLEDARGVLVDKLSSLMGVRVLDRQDGSIGVVAGDTLLVDGGKAQQIEVRGLPGGGIGIGVVGAASTLDANGGKIGAITDLTENRIPAIRAKLDQLASAIVTQVNTLHQAGYNQAGVTGTDFFDPANTTARTISLAAGIAASGANIAAGATAGAGDGAVALQLGALRTTGIASLGGATAGEFYVSLISGLGVDVRNAGQDAEAAGVLAANAYSMRSSQTGVSTDEEMVALITQQQAYTAATKLVNVADEMMQSLLAMV